MSGRGGNVLFVVHGVGTGRLRTAVLDFLRSHPMVESTADEKESNGGCTVAYLC
jgi:DNA mismatch repair protein MutS2